MSNVILVLNTRNGGPKSLVWIEKERVIKDRFPGLELLHLPLYCFDDLGSALEITDRFMQDDRDSVRLVLDNTWRGFKLACVKDPWWIIKCSAAQNAVYEASGSPDSMRSKVLQRIKDNIMDWIVGKTSANAHMLWLYGGA